MGREKDTDSLSEEKKSIWKLEHTPLSERVTSSGMTFRCKEVAENGKKHK